MSRDDAVRAAAEALASRMGPPVDQWPRYYAGLAEAAVDAAAPHLTADLVRERDEVLAQSERDLADALIYKARWNEALAEVERLRAEVERMSSGVGPGDPAECPGAHGPACCGYPDICAAALRGES